MKQLLILVILTFSFVCTGQKTIQKYQDVINFKDIIEIDGLIYYRTDTTLVSGKVIRYNKKNKAKKYVLVSKGVANNSGWIQVYENHTPNKDSGLGTALYAAAFITGTVMSISGNDVDLPIGEYDKKQYLVNSHLSEQNKNGLLVESNNLVSDEISSNLDSGINKNKGPHQEFYENGQLKSKGNYVDGKKDGYWQEYHSNGNVQSKAKFIKGVMVGLMETYYFDEQVFGRIHYKEGKENGLAEVYHKNGQLMMKGFFRDAIQKGEWKYYNDMGILIKTEKYED